MLCRVRQSPWQVINENYFTCRQLGTPWDSGPRPRPLKTSPFMRTTYTRLCAPSGDGEALPRLHTTLHLATSGGSHRETPALLHRQTPPKQDAGFFGLRQPWPLAEAARQRKGPAPLRVSEERNVHARLSLPHALLDCYAELSEGCARDNQLGPVAANHLQSAHKSGSSLRGQVAVKSTTRLIFSCCRCRDW